MRKKLNPQGMARGHREFMSTMVPDEGCVFISSDMSSGEPTVITEFSKDKNYYDATFGMVGKAPYYSGDILKIDDIYLTGMSVSPMGKAKLRQVFDSTFNGNTFSEQWLIDPEHIKKLLKAERQLHKIMILGLGYGMGIKKLVTSAYEKGYTVSYDQAKGFYNGYWDLFADVKRFANYLQHKAENEIYIVNVLGFRMKPEPRKAFNYFVQSTISSIFHIFVAKVFDQANYAKFITVIHDELIVQIPKAKIEHFREVIQKASDSVNDDLKWGVKLRFGFAVGSNLYEAK